MLTIGCFGDAAAASLTIDLEGGQRRLSESILKSLEALGRREPAIDGFQVPK
jgi:hypothetical protein